jgi:predicted transglutaminase-like protease
MREELMHQMKTMVVLLMVVLVIQPLCAVAQTQAVIKEKLDKIPIGSTVEVKLLRKDSNKIKGKLMLIGSESFEIQTVQSGTESTAKIAFADVKSVKKSGLSMGAKVGIWMAVGVGAAVGVAALIYVNHGG